MKITQGDFELLVQTIRKDAVSDISILKPRGSDRFVLFGYEDKTGFYNEIKLFNNGADSPTKATTVKLEQK